MSAHAAVGDLLAGHVISAPDLGLEPCTVAHVHRVGDICFVDLLDIRSGAVLGHRKPLRADRQVVLHDATDLTR